jgi:1,2-diacylglycerol 3-alpha-glucosyltransferase
MKIVVASSGLGHVARGIEAWASDLGRALRERGQRVTLCKGGGEVTTGYERIIPCWHRTAPMTEWLIRGPFRRGFWRLGLESGYGIEQTTFALNLLSHLRQEVVDVLHIQDPQVALIVQRARRLGWVRTRTILANGTNEPLAFLRKVTYLQHLSTWHLEEARAAGVWKPTWTALPNFIDFNLFHPGRADTLRDELGIPRHGIVLLTAAAIKREHKRIDHLFGEFARFREARPDIPAWLVVAGGRETDTDDLIEEGRQLLGDRLRTLVGFPRERMPELYRAADAFVLCSLRECFGIVLLESAATGLPSLIHPHPVMRSIVGPGGRTVDMEAPGALAAVIGELLSDGPRRQALGRLARQHCVENYGVERVVDRILDYYHFVLTHDRASAGGTSEGLAAMTASPVGQ